MASGCEAGKRPWWVAGFLLVALLFPAAPAVAALGGTGKYYIVGAPAGRREYLYDIALQTMGNGNRFREIIALNKGRRQPDGATLTDGVEVAPGWILMLPADASGLGVRTGALPPIAVQRPSSPPPRPKPSTMKPNTTTPSITTPSVTTATSTTDVPVTREQPAVTRIDLSYLFRVLAAVLAVVLAALALLVLRRGAAQRRRVPVEDGPWPPERHHTPTPAELAALAAAESAPFEAVAGDQLVPPRPEPSEPEPPVATPWDWSPDLPRPGLPRVGELPYVEADLESETGPIRVRLAGVTEAPAGEAYAWLGKDEPTPTASVPLVLGHAGPWWLHVDLGRAPDVLTLVGAPDDCRRLAVTFARQLHSDGIPVAVVGDALGAIEGLYSLTGFPQPGDEPPGRSVVIAADLPEDGLAGVRGFVEATGGRCVPMLIGEVPKGRWSLRVGAAV